MSAVVKTEKTALSKVSTDQNKHTVYVFVKCSCERILAKTKTLFVHIIYACF